MRNFLYENGENPLQENCQAVVLPIPMEKTTSYLKGTANAPSAILEASAQVEYFDAELQRDISKLGIFTDFTLAQKDLNDLPSEEIIAQISKVVWPILDQGKFLLALGGEHTISVGVFPPFAEKYKDDITILQIDAHADLKDEYQGNRLSHACVMRRLMGLAPIVSVGIRSIDQEEANLISEASTIDVFYAHQIRNLENWQDQVLSKIRTKNVYLSVDVDGFDPSVIPSVGTPQPGGLFWDETLRLFSLVASKHQIVGSDINELRPDGSTYANFTTAKLCAKILAYSIFGTS